MKFKVKVEGFGKPKYKAKKGKAQARQQSLAEIPTFMGATQQLDRRAGKMPQPNMPRITPKFRKLR